MQPRIKTIHIKTVLLVLFSIIHLFTSCSNKVKDQEKFEIKKGTNIAHWLSQSDKRGEERRLFFTEDDVIKIANMGFDHIRLPIDEEQMWDENGNKNSEAFQLMQNCINWCSKNNLKIIIDLHILRSHHFNAKEKPLWTDPKAQETFFNLWKDLSKSLSKHPNSLVAYELMNEAVADDNESWNKLLLKAFTTIRELEKERTIVIGSNRWQSVETFDALKVPANDKNILLSFHFYKPFLLTHYAAKWTNLKNYNGATHYPGIILTQQEYEKLPPNIQTEVQKWVNVKFNKDILLEMWQKPIQKAKDLDLPLYCGEFGIISNAPNNESINWYKDIVTLFNETGIGYANWNYKSDDFGLIHTDGKENKTLIKIVSGSN